MAHGVKLTWPQGAFRLGFSTTLWVGEIDDDNDYSNAHFSTINLQADDVINDQTGNLHLGESETRVLSHEGYTVDSVRIFIEPGQTVTVAGQEYTADRRGYIKADFTPGQVTEFTLGANSAISRIDFYLDIIEEYGEGTAHPNAFPTIVGDYEGDLPTNFIKGDPEGDFTATHIHITDGEPFSTENLIQAETLTYSRTFTAEDAGQWHSLYLPYGISDFSGFASEVVAFSSVKELEDNVLQLVCTKVIDELEPNTIYLFKPKAGASFPTLSNVVVKPIEGTTLQTKSSDNYTVTLTGIYSPMEDMTAEGTYAVKGETIHDPNAPSPNVPTDGSTTAVDTDFEPSTDADMLPSFRVFLTLDKKENAVTPTAIKIEVVDKDSTVGIETINMDTITDEIFFNLQGQPVRSPLPGIYLLKGRKVIVL